MAENTKHSARDLLFFQMCPAAIMSSRTAGDKGEREHGRALWGLESVLP